MVELPILPNICLCFPDSAEGCFGLRGWGGADWRYRGILQFSYQVCPNNASLPVIATCHFSDVKEILSRADVLWTEVVSLWIEKNGTVKWRPTSNPPRPPIPPPVPPESRDMHMLHPESKGLNAFVPQARLWRSKRSSDIKCIIKIYQEFWRWTAILYVWSKYAAELSEHSWFFVCLSKNRS